MNTGPALLLSALLIALNAFFVGAEFAIVSARRSQIEPKAEAGSSAARTVLWAMERVSLMLACAQLGITMCSVGLGAIAEPALAHLIEAPLHALHLPTGLAHPIALVIALAIVVYLHVVLGEMVPKNLTVSGPDRAVLWFGPPLVWISRILGPIIKGLNWLANHILRLFRVEPKDEVASAFTAEEVAAIVKLSKAEGVLQDEDDLLSGAIEFSVKRAADVMVPLDQLVTVPAQITPAGLESLVAQTGYSRFPVLVDDAVTGYLHLKDVLAASDEQRNQPVPAARIRPLAIVAPGDEIEDVLRAMQSSGAHLAAVDDESRQLGVVFMEDILEELVGEVRDQMQRAR